MSRTSRIAASVALVMLAASPALSQSGSSAASGSGTGSSGGGISGGGPSGGGIGAGGGLSSTADAPRPVSPTGSITGSGSSGSGLASGSSSGIRTNADTMTNSGVGVGGNTGISSSAPANESASDGIGTGGASTEQLATEGSSMIDSANADAIARTGNAGAATAVQGSGEQSLGDTTSSIGGSPQTSLSGTGRPQDYKIPTPRIGVDLEAIRGAMDAESSATPKPNGN